MISNQPSKLMVSFACGCLLLGTSACQSLKNGWLDPTIVGDFKHQTTHEIRASLTIEDSPSGLPGSAYPTQGDLKVIPVDYPISPGDELAVEINELRQRQVPYQARIGVGSTGSVNLPVVGRIHAAGLTIPEFEQTVIKTLKDQQVLLNPEVTVNPLFIQKGTYSLFGVGVSASDNSPLRAGSFPIPRPDLRVLEAINRVGGLNEFVTDIYVYRYDNPIDGGSAKPTADELVNGRSNTSLRESERSAQLASHRLTAEQELVAAALPLQVQEAEQEPGQPEVDDVPGDLLPELSQPYIYVNDQWQRNPAYDGGEEASLPVNDAAIAPAVNWSRIAGDSTYRIIRIPAESLRDGDPAVNIVVRPGDVIRIVSGEIGLYYVMGQTNRVGPFQFNAEQVTLKTAIAVAGGLSGLAWPDRCTIYRRIGQREQMIQVDLDRIFAGKDPDFVIKRNDIINVGTHPFAPFLQRIRALTLPTPANTVGYSFTYARNYADIDSFSVRANPHNEPDRFPNLFP